MNHNKNDEYETIDENENKIEKPKPGKNPHSKQLL